MQLGQRLGHDRVVREAWHVGAALGLDLAQVWARAGKGEIADDERIHVAILDSGVAAAGGLPAGRIVQFDSFGNRDERHDLTNTFHGTQVVSVLASDAPEAIGVAPAVRCSCFNVYGSQQKPMESRVVAALEHAVAMNVDLICCTFTLERLSNDLRQRLDAARAASIPVVVSASDTDQSWPFPDSARGLICVTASTMIKTVLNRSATCSAIISAPGSSIVAVTPVGVSEFSGTSAAAPVAAGIIALLLAHARKRGVEPWFRGVLGELLVKAANRATTPPLIDPRALLQAIDDAS